MVWCLPLLLCAVLGSLGLIHVAVSEVDPDQQMRNWTAQELNCPDFDSRWLPQAEYVPLGTPYRALRTAPPGLTIAKSSIPGAGLGVFSTVFVPRYTYLAEYEGEVVIDRHNISHYSWNVHRSLFNYYFLDGYNMNTSNWLRYVNCPIRRSQENLMELQCYDKVYYMTKKNIHPGQELFVYYGDAYAKFLNIDTEAYYNS